MTFGILHKAMRIVFRTMIIVEISMNELMTYDKREIVLVFHTVGRYNAGISRYQTESLNAPVFLSADATLDVPMGQSDINAVFVSFRRHRVNNFVCTVSCLGVVH